MESLSSRELCVIHSFPNWLPQTQTWMYNQVKYLPENIDTHVVCEETENLDQFAVPNIHCLRDISITRSSLEKWMRKFRMRYLLSYLSFVSKEVGAQIIHSHFGHIGWTNMIAAKHNKLQHVVTFYGADINKLPIRDKTWIKRYHELFDRTDVFLCEGPHMAGKLVEMGCPAQKVSIHHLGVEVDQIPFMPRQWRKGEGLNVLIAGAFREKKGIPDALKALAGLKDAVPFTVTVIGDAGPERSSKDEKRRILQTLSETGLESKTRLLGFQPYTVLLEEAYKHHIFISPSLTASDGDTEGGAPVSILEMIATGMPVVSTTHCDIPEVIHYGIDGWLVKEHDIQGLTERLVWLIEHAGKWNGLLVSGRRYVAANFNVIQQGRSLAQIYENMLSV
jgi:colanic acid/amylovoran biosynthesis glycosyltransferase